MRTGLKFKLVLAATMFLTAFAANAHFISGTPDAPAHNASHVLPSLGLLALMGLIGAAARRCFKRK